MGEEDLISLLNLESHFNFKIHSSGGRVEPGVDSASSLKFPTQLLIHVKFVSKEKLLSIYFVLILIEKAKPIKLFVKKFIHILRKKKKAFIRE